MRFLRDLLTLVRSSVRLLGIYGRRVFGRQPGVSLSSAAGYDPETGLSIADLTRKGNEMAPLAEVVPPEADLLHVGGMAYDKRTGVLRVPAGSRVPDTMRATNKILDKT